MSYTNSTPNYNLPQWIGTDKPTFLGDFNGAFSAIDTAMKDNADASSAATSTANAANATAVSANTNANTALNTANNAKDTADAATTAAASATSTANNAKTTADNAARAALSNNISNLAPAYDNTLTYAVGDLVTFVDQNNSGRLYRCIIAVNTPGDFNVNYWDDVTASEAFDRAQKVIKLGDYIDPKGWADVADDLYTALENNSDFINGYTQVLFYTLDGFTVYNIARVRKSNHTYRFVAPEVAANAYAVRGFDLTSTTKTHVAYTSQAGQSPTITDDTSSVFTNASSAYLIFK